MKADPRTVDEKMKGWEQQYPRKSNEEELKLYEELKEKYSRKGIKEGNNSSIKYDDKEEFNGFAFKENKIKC